MLYRRWEQDVDWTIRLFLGGSGLLLLGLRPLFALASQTGVAASDTELPDGSLLAWVVGNLALLDLDFVADGEEVVALDDLALVAALAGLLHLLGRGLASLRRLGLAREEHQALLVLLQALDVGLERLLAQVLATRVDGDTDGRRQLAGDTSFLETHK